MRLRSAVDTGPAGSYFDILDRALAVAGKLGSRVGRQGSSDNCCICFSETVVHQETNWTNCNIGLEPDMNIMGLA